MKKPRLVASLVAAATFAFVASPALATPTMPDGESLYTVLWPQDQGNAVLGKIGSDGIATPIGTGDADVYNIRDADYDWVHNLAYVVADSYASDGTCDIWTVDLVTGEYTFAWAVYDSNGENMTFCDALMIGGVDNSEIWISGTDHNDAVANLIYNRTTGAYIEPTAETDLWQAMDYDDVNNRTTYYFNGDDAGGRFYNALDSNAVWLSGYDNMHSISYTQEGQLWFIDWNEGVEIGQVDPTTGVVDLLTNDLRFENGDQWGTDAIFWGPSDPTASQSGAGLASTGVDASGIALGGIALMALGAVVAIRRRATR